MAKNRAIDPEGRNRMNIRKNIDYSSLYDEIDRVLAADFSQIELYLELGRLVSGKPEKGAAVMAAEYITANYPDRTGFSPRNLRRMRDFYRIYEGHPEVFKQAMEVGWTQNIVILEADLDMEGRSWYLRAVRQFGWSKAELTGQIAANAHLQRANEESIPDGERNGFPEALPLRVERLLRFLGHAAAFWKKLCYNGPWQLHFPRQTGIIGEAYG